MDANAPPVVALRACVAPQDGGNSYAEYGIQCMYRTPGLDTSESILKWKLFRRYREFKELDTCVSVTCAF